MKRQSRNSITIASAAVIILTTFAAGVFVGSSQTSSVVDIDGIINEANGKPTTVDFSPYWKAWNVIDKHFVPAGTSSEGVTNEDRVWESIQGLTNALDDPHTRFMPPVQSKRFEEDISGDFGGVGMEVGMRDGVLTVISPLADSPAQKAGVISQDRVIEIDGTSTHDMSVDEAVTHIRGERGTEVELTIVREGEQNPLTLSITRGIIQIPTIDYYLRSDGIYVIKLQNFSEKSPMLFRQAIKSFRRSPSNRLIFDLRQNPGGFLGAAVDMASYFLPEGKVVVREDGGEKNEKLDHVFRSKGYDIFDEGLNMVVLVDAGSASASEILAGALGEHGVATMVGTETFGKGSVQELIQITAKPKTSLKLTVAHWLTPNGNLISQGGLTPEVIVERTAQQYRNGVDPQMEKAVEILGG